VVCIPVVLIFTYEWGLGLKVKGIWMGFGIANAILLILYATVLFTTDWEL
jgi:Na+-driven multidrug efflux pump